MEFNELIEKSLKKLDEFDPETLISALLYANDGAKADVRNKDTCAYYSWFPGFLELLKPSQVVELGSAMGVGDICMLECSYKDFQLYGITLEEHGLEFEYIPEKSKYPNFHAIVGDDLDLDNWPKDLDLSETDLWFFDSLHQEDQLRSELNLYKQFFKKGAYLLFDDMHLNEGMSNVLADLGNIIPIKNIAVNDRLHWSGFTVVELK